MKNIIKAICVIAFICYGEVTMAQLNREQAVEQGVLNMQKKLGLSDAVTNEVRSAGKELLKQLDHLKKDQNMSLAARQQETQKLQVQYDAKMKRLLTTEQWTKYQQMRITAQENARKLASQKKIREKEQGQQ